MLVLQNKTCTSLSYTIIAIAFVATVGGIFFPIYRDTAVYATTWRANDMVTLFVVLPALFTAVQFSKKKLAAAVLTWIGLLAYMLYNYAFYLFGASFNVFFLLYAALFSLSMYTLFILLYNTDVVGISKQFIASKWYSAIAVFLVFISLPLAIFEVGQCMQFIFSDKLPAAPTLIFALDISIVVPTSFIAAILLFKRRPWGYILSAMMLVKAFAYGLVLSLATAMVADFHWQQVKDPLLPFYLFVCIGGITGSVIMFSKIIPTKTRLYDTNNTGGAPDYTRTIAPGRVHQPS
jgi:hypothetical protein